ncbi:MAG: hypothetical protein IJT65_01125 [Eubacterium sp.]|nr:hypothetical protein [Eubacterium sp.]
MFLIKALFYIIFFPFIILYKLLFWWLPSAPDSYETNDEEWLFWKGHGHDW